MLFVYVDCMHHFVRAKLVMNIFPVRFYGEKTKI